MTNKYEFYDLKKVEKLANHPEVIEDDGYYWDPTPMPEKDYLDSEVPEGIKKVADFVRSKMLGIHTREAMARLGEMMGINVNKATNIANEAEQIAKTTRLRQENLESETAQSVAQMEADKDAVIANATVDSEVILARGGKPTLGARLDETTAQLAQNTEYTTTNFNYLNDSKKERKVIVSFIADDCPKTDLTKLVPIMQEKNIPIGFGVITDRVGKIVPNQAGTMNHEYMDWDDIRYVKSLGGEIMAHTHEHRNSTQLSEDVLYDDIATNKRILSEQGFIADGFIYPYNAFNSITKNIVKRKFKYSFGRYTSNTPKIDNNSINRYSLGSYYDSPSLSPKGYNTSSLEYYKERVDIAIERDEWLVFVLHTHEGVFDGTQQQHLRDVIDYIRSLGVEIVSPREGFERYGNVLQVGESYIAMDGRVDLKIGDYGIGDYAIISRTSNKELTSNHITPFDWDEVSHTGREFIDIADDGSIRFTEAGHYLITLRVVFEKNENGVRMVRANNLDYRELPIPTNVTNMDITRFESTIGGPTSLYKVFVVQNSGGPLNVICSGSTNTRAIITKLKGW